MDLERLAREIRNQHASVLSAIRARKEHPSYGYTKARIVEAENRLHGMIDAYLYVSGIWEHSGAIIYTQDILDRVNAVLDVDLDALTSAVRAS